MERTNELTKQKKQMNKQKNILRKQRTEAEKPTNRRTDSQEELQKMVQLANHKRRKNTPRLSYLNKRAGRGMGIEIAYLPYFLFIFSPFSLIFSTVSPTSYKYSWQVLTELFLTIYATW